MAWALAVAVAITLALPAVRSGAVSARTEVPRATALTATSTTSGSTTTVPATTTTTVPAATTTVAPTTSTVPRTTTSSTRVATTTTTTTTPLLKNTSSSTPWWLIVLIVVLVLLIGLVIALLVLRRKRAAEAAWHRAVVPALADAQLARQSLLSGNATSEDPEVRGAVGVQAERAARALEQAAHRAPDTEYADLTTSVATSLRGLAFAVEADRLLRHGSVAPTGTQLAEADQARRARDVELGTALARLSARTSSKGTGSRSR